METSPLDQAPLPLLVAGLADLDEAAVGEALRLAARRTPGSLAAVGDLVVLAAGQLGRVTTAAPASGLGAGAALPLARRSFAELARRATVEERPRLYPVSDVGAERTRQAAGGAPAPTAAIGAGRSPARGADNAQTSLSPRPRLVVTCPPGSEHLLGAEIVAEVLASEGWMVDLVPLWRAAMELDGLLATRAPLAVVASASQTSGLPALAGVIRSAHRRRLPVLVTGAALGSDELRAIRLGADLWAPGMAAVTEGLDHWLEHLPAVATGTPGSGEYRAFDSSRSEIWLTALGASGPDRSEAAERIIGELVEYLAAAVLVDDSRVLLDHATEALAAAAGDESSSSTLLGAVEALAAAVPGRLGAASRFVAETCEHLRRALSRSTSASLRSIGAVPDVAAVRPAVAPFAAPRMLAAAPAIPGQDFADLLLLGAQAGQGAVTLLSVRQGDGQWHTLSHGTRHRDGLADPALFELLAASHEPVEVSDLTASPSLARSPLVAAPHHLRRAYGTALRSPEGILLGVYCVVDRAYQDLTRRETDALRSTSRLLAGRLDGLRRFSVRPGGPAPMDPGRSTVPGGGTVGFSREAELGEGQHMMRSHQVAALFDVTERTVINWAASEKLPSLRTIGGHLRFRSDDVQQLLQESEAPRRRRSKHLA